MRKEDNATINPRLRDVPKKLRSARNRVVGVHGVIICFAEYIADIAEKGSKYNYDFIPETMMKIIDDAIKAIESDEDKVGIQSVPKELKGRGQEIRSNMHSFYIIIDEIAEEEFAEKFKKMMSLW